MYRTDGDQLCLQLSSPYWKRPSYNEVRNCLTFAALLGDPSWHNAAVIWNTVSTVRKVLFWENPSVPEDHGESWMGQAWDAPQEVWLEQKMQDGKLLSKEGPGMEQNICSQKELQRSLWLVCRSNAGGGRESDRLFL